jgi:hypothetical protein
MTKKTTSTATTLAAIDYNALADAIAERIVPALMVAARLAAADTARTVERTETVLRRAIEEGRIAAGLAHNSELSQKCHN